MRKLLALFTMLLFSQIVAAQIYTDPLGRAIMERKPAEATMVDTDSVMITRGADQITRTISLAEFKALLPGGGGDNLGNHTATESLKMAGFDIVNGGNVELAANKYYEITNGTNTFRISWVTDQVYLNPLTGTAFLYDFSDAIWKVSALHFPPTDTEPTFAQKGSVYFDDSESTLKQHTGVGWEAIGSGGGSQTLSLGGTGNKDLTISGGNTVDLETVTLIANALQKNLTNLVTSPMGVNDADGTGYVISPTTDIFSLKGGGAADQAEIFLDNDLIVAQIRGTQYMNISHNSSVVFGQGIFYDNTTSGLLADTFKAAIDEVVATAVTSLADLSDVGTASAGLGEVLIGNGATYNSNPLTAALVTYNNATSGLTATIVQDGIDENAANHILLADRVTTLETTAGDYGTRIQAIEDALNTPASSVRVNEVETAPYVFVVADAEDRKQKIFDYNDEGATLNGGLFPTGTILNVLGDPASAGEVRMLEGTNVSFVGYTDGAIITPGVPFTLERIGTATTPETWYVLGPSVDVSDYVSELLGPELLTNGTDFSSGWGYQNGSSASGGVATAIGNGSPIATAANHVVYQDITALTALTQYKLVITWRRTVGSGNAYVSEKFANLQTEASLSGTFVEDTYYFTANGQDRIAIGADSGTTLEIDSISLKEVL